VNGSCADPGAPGGGEGTTPPGGACTSNAQCTSRICTNGVCQARDSDNDGLPDDVDPNPNNPDTDGDGLLDGQEDRNRNGRVDDGETDPTDPDTDHDGLLDGQEDKNKNGVVDSNETNPLNPNTDGDCLLDGVDPYPLDPTRPDCSKANDTDKDGVYDNIEKSSGCMNINNPDTDGDGLLDGQEDKNHNGKVDAGETNPCKADSDGNGIKDGDQCSVIKKAEAPRTSAIVRSSPSFFDWVQRVFSGFISTVYAIAGRTYSDYSEPSDAVIISGGVGGGGGGNNDVLSLLAPDSVSTSDASSIVVRRIGVSWVDAKNTIHDGYEILRAPFIYGSPIVFTLIARITGEEARAMTDPTSINISNVPAIVPDSAYIYQVRPFVISQPPAVADGMLRAISADNTRIVEAGNQERKSLHIPTNEKVTFVWKFSSAEKCDFSVVAPDGTTTIQLPDLAGHHEVAGTATFLPRSGKYTVQCEKDGGQYKIITSHNEIVITVGDQTSDDSVLFVSAGPGTNSPPRTPHLQPIPPIVLSTLTVKSVNVSGQESTSAITIDSFSCMRDNCTNDVVPGTAENQLGNQHKYTVGAFGRRVGNDAILPVSAGDMTWRWEITSTVAGVTGSVDATNSSKYTLTARQISSAKVKGTAALKITGTQKSTGRSETVTIPINIEVCDFPWPSTPPYSSGQLDFSMHYCAGVGTQNLPLLADSEIQVRYRQENYDFDYEYLFPIDATKLGSQSSNDNIKSDVIVLRVSRTSDTFDIVRWYQDTFRATPSPHEPINGYPAVQDATGVYVLAYDTSMITSSPKLKTYLGSVAGIDRDDTTGAVVYYFTTNTNAQAATREILNTLLANIQLSKTKPFFDTNSDGALLRRDVKRIVDFEYMARALSLYASRNGTYPKIESGSFIKNATISAWSTSWNDLMRSIGLSPVPDDPQGAVHFPDSPCGGSNYERSTCWNVTDKKFGYGSGTSADDVKTAVGSAGVHAYSYKFATLNSYEMCAKFETLYIGGSVESQLFCRTDSVVPSVRLTRPPDTQAPEVTWNTESFVSGSNVTLRVSANDNRAVTSVIFYLNQSLLASVSDFTDDLDRPGSYVFTYVWDSTVYDGRFMLSAEASDAAGNKKKIFKNVDINNATTDPQIDMFQVYPDTIISGESAILKWKVTGYNNGIVLGSISGSPYRESPYEKEGERTISPNPTQTTTYRLSISNTKGDALQDTVLTVLPAGTIAKNICPDNTLLMRSDSILRCAIPQIIDRFTNWTNVCTGWDYDTYQAVGSDQLKCQYRPSGALTNPSVCAAKNTFRIGSRYYCR
ncbi:MAG: hypothetical protein Q8P56_06960, partial [Candidatus Uhrbacteria bacterium]|nr:hypothetical protein [Candidatus Uhrbacteria bacterium]